MAKNTIIVKNSTVAGKLPAAGVPGELFVNVADKLIGTFDASGAAVTLGGASGSAPPIDSYSEHRTYGVSELVTGGGSIFKCITAITTPEPWDGTKWQDMFPTPVTPTIVAYDGSKTYAVGDFCSAVGAVWQCVKAITAGKAWDYGDWVKALPGPITTFSATATYNTDDLVVNAGHLYRAKAAVAAAAFDATQWDEIGAASSGGSGGGGGGGGSSPITDFDATKPYKPNDLVAKDGHIYRANTALVAGAFHPVEWTNIADSDGVIASWAPNKTYKAGTLVVHNDKIYVSGGGLASATFNPASWTEYVHSNVAPGIRLVSVDDMEFGESVALLNMTTGGFIVFTLVGGGGPITILLGSATPDVVVSLSSGEQAYFCIPYAPIGGAPVTGASSLGTISGISATVKMYGPGGPLDKSAATILENKVYWYEVVA